MAKVVCSPEDKEASRRRLMEAQRSYHSHAQDLVDSFHSPHKTSEYLRKQHELQCAREGMEREQKMSVAAEASALAAVTTLEKASALAAAASLEVEQAKSSSPNATTKPKSNARYLWKKTIATVQKENEAKARRQARESMTRVTAFGAGMMM